MNAPEYAEGYEYGIGWALADRRDGLGTQSEEIARLREESRTEQRWARAFYLGALRGYREITRTFAHGRWGT